MQWKRELFYVKHWSEWTKWPGKKPPWPRVDKRSHFGWSVIWFSSWGLTQPLDLESSCLRRCSEHREWIKLLLTFGWRGTKSLFQFRWYMEKILPSTPNRLTKDPQCMSSCCLCSMLELTPLALHTVSVPQRGGVGASRGTAVSLAQCSRWEEPSHFSLQFELHLHFWEMGIHISLGHPSAPSRTQAAGLRASICTQFMLLDLKYRGQGERETWDFGECKGHLKSCHYVIVILI